MPCDVFGHGYGNFEGASIEPSHELAPGHEARKVAGR